jgi:hypothetical protein
MAGPTLAQKLQHMYNFAMNRGHHVSHIWTLYKEGIALKAWGGNRDVQNRLFSWAELETVTRAGAEGAITLLFDLVEKNDKQKVQS